MNGRSARFFLTSASASIPEKCGMEKSEMTRFQSCESQADCKAAGVSTRTKFTSYPPRRNSRTTSSLSSSESSAINTRIGMPILRSPAWWRFIQNQPVQTELTDSLPELIEVYRLTNVAVGSEAIANKHVFFLGRGSQKHDRKKFGAWVGAQPAKHGKSVQFGKLQIQQDHLGTHFHVATCV